MTLTLDYNLELVASYDLARHWRGHIAFVSLCRVVVLDPVIFPEPLFPKGFVPICAVERWVETHFRLLAGIGGAGRWRKGINALVAVG